MAAPMRSITGFRKYPILSHLVEKTWLSRTHGVYKEEINAYCNFRISNGLRNMTTSSIVGCMKFYVGTACSKCVKTRTCQNYSHLFKTNRLYPSSGVCFYSGPGNRKNSKYVLSCIKYLRNRSVTTSTEGIKQDCDQSYRGGYWDKDVFRFPDRNFRDRELHMHNILPVVPYQQVTCCANHQLCRNFHASSIINAHEPDVGEKVSETKVATKHISDETKEQVKLAKDKVKEQLGELREGMFTIPNVLTFSRMVAAPVIGYLVLNHFYVMACGVFIYAGITDLLDGWIARNFPNQTSALGSFLDPLADKMLVSVLFVSLAMVHLLPVSLTALVIARDIGLIIAAFYVRYISITPPVTLVRFFDLTYATAQLKPLFLSKLNTAIQLGLVAVTLGAPVFGFVDHFALQALWYVTAGTTVASGVSYMFAKDTFKILQQRRRQKGSQ